MKIKKVDDKPMVIHTKEKAKIHTHEPKQAAIKGSNVYTDANTLLGVNTDNRSEIDESLNRFPGAQKEFFRTSFIHFLDSYPLAKEVG